MESFFLVSFFQLTGKRKAIVFYKTLKDEYLKKALLSILRPANHWLLIPVIEAVSIHCGYYVKYSLKLCDNVKVTNHSGVAKL